MGSDSGGKLPAVEDAFWDFINYLLTKFLAVEDLRPTHYGGMILSLALNTTAREWGLVRDSKGVERLE